MRDRCDEIDDLRCQNPLGGHHTIQITQLARVIGGGNPTDDEPIDEAAGKSHAHPNPDGSSLVEFRRNKIVELTVQMG